MEAYLWMRGAGCSTYRYGKKKVKNVGKMFKQKIQNYKM